MKGLVLLVSFLAVVAGAQPPQTSDSRETRAGLPMPPTHAGRAPIYVPPVDDVYDELITNMRPMVVEVTVWSNEVRRTVWHKKGEPFARTNISILSSNVIVVATNIATNVVIWGTYERK